MIDWLISKLGMLIAIGVVTGFILGLFSWQHGIMVDKQSQELADDVASMIDGLAGLDASVRLNMSFGNEPGQLPYTLDGKEYEINITSNMVIISQSRKQWVSHLIEPVICQNISDRQFNLTEYNEFSTAEFIKFDSNQDFILERAAIDVSGQVKYVTLVYY